MMKAPRIATFSMLLVMLALVAFVFYRVISGFLLPLFLAALLTVIFRPLNRWFVEKCRGRQRTAAILTTLSIFLAVFTPLGVVLAMAIHEGNQLLAQQRGDMIGTLKQQIVRVTNQFGLQRPFVNDFASAEDTLNSLHRLLEPETLSEPTRLRVASLLVTLVRSFNQLGEQFAQLDAYIAELAEKGIADKHIPSSAQAAAEAGVELPAAFIDGRWTEAELTGVKRLRASGELDEILVQLQRNQDSMKQLHDRLLDPNEPPDTDILAELRELVGISQLLLVNVSTDLRGGPIRAWASDLVSPGEEQYALLQGKIRDVLQSWLPSVTGQATALIGGLIFGLIIMAISLYYFFIDGPAMVAAVMKLSPLDDQYEHQLLAEFDQISRAVVVATLLAAVVQGGLAGIGFFFAGLDSVFLLTALTMVLALVPFVGAAAVWVPACIWLAAVDGRWLAAVLLAVWGFAVVSMADNFIKPLVLHGQSKLHPLLGLLSVLGGVQTLGPIGILVGPIAVALLQAVLVMINKELSHWSTAE